MICAARVKRGWPTAVLKVPDNHIYNDMYNCVDDISNLILRMVDSNTVLMVTTAHNPKGIVQRARRELLDTTNAAVPAYFKQQYIRCYLETSNNPAIKKEFLMDFLREYILRVKRIPGGSRYVLHNTPREKLTD